MHDIIITKIAPATLVPKGVTFDKRRGLFRARTRDAIQKHLGYFTSLSMAALAVEVDGVSVDNARNVSKFRVRLNGKHVGYFKTRTAAVKTVINTMLDNVA